MQGRTGPLLWMIARLRALRAFDSWQDPEAREASPVLIRLAIMLAVLLAMLEIDLHGPELQSLGLFGNTSSDGPLFAGP